MYFNRRPVYVSVKTFASINEFRDVPYDRVSERDGTVTGESLFITGNGSEIAVRDKWSMTGGALKIAREAEARRANSDDLGFQTKISFYQAAPQKQDL